jgi:hypothetical protein
LPLTLLRQRDVLRAHEHARAIVCGHALPISVTNNQQLIKTFLDIAKDIFSYFYFAAVELCCEAMTLGCPRDELGSRGHKHVARDRNGTIRTFTETGLSKAPLHHGEAKADDRKHLRTSGRASL